SGVSLPRGGLDLPLRPGDDRVASPATGRIVTRNVSTRQAPAATVAAVLEPDERLHVDAIGHGNFSLVHRDSLRDAIRMVRERPVDAVLFSVRRCAGDGPALLEQFTRAFPAVPAIALLTRN